MRVMVFVKATEDSEAGVMPTTELMEAMGKFNEELVNAGIMLEGDGLKPSSQGKRVAFDGPNRTVIDGPFAETRELVAGYWIWEVKDLAEQSRQATRQVRQILSEIQKAVSAAVMTTGDLLDLLDDDRTVVGHAGHVSSLSAPFGGDPAPRRAGHD